MKTSLFPCALPRNDFPCAGSTATCRTLVVEALHQAPHQLYPERRVTAGFPAGKSPQKPVQSTPQFGGVHSLFLLVKSEIIWLNTNLSEVNFPMFVGKTRLAKSMLLIPIDSFLNLHSFPNIGYCFYSLLNPHVSLGHHGCGRREHRILRGQRRCGADLWRAGRCGGLLQGTLQPLPHLGEWRFAKNVCQKYVYIYIDIDITMYIMYIYIIIYTYIICFSLYMVYVF